MADKSSTILGNLIRKTTKQPAADLGVFMVGGRRTGKTTILSSMNKGMDEVTKDTNLILSWDSGDMLDLSECTDTLNNYFKSDETIFYSDMDPTYDMKRYMYKLKVAGERDQDAIRISFTDIPGEWFEHNDPDQMKTIQETMDESQVIIIAIDTPALMEDPNEDGIGERHMEFNRVNVISNYIANMEIKENMMVLFVPLKCEKYYHKTYDTLMNPQNINYMEKIIDNVKKGYSKLFDNILTAPNLKNKVTVAITPIITVGGLDFFAFDEGQDRTIFGEQFYKITNASYSPQFCEQPLLYTLAFAVKQFRQNGERANTQNRSIWSKIWSIFRGSKQKVPEINTIIKNIKRNSKDGYEIVQNPSHI